MGRRGAPRRAGIDEVDAGPDDVRAVIDDELLGVELPWAHREAILDAFVTVES